MSKFCQGTNCTQSFDLKRKVTKREGKREGILKKLEMLKFSLLINLSLLVIFSEF